MRTKTSQLSKLTGAPGTVSSPIHADTLEAATEILSRTYTPDRFELVPYRKIDYGRIWFGARYAWQFQIKSREVMP